MKKKNAYFPAYGSQLNLGTIKETIKNSFPEYDVKFLEKHFWRPLLVDDKHKFVYVPISKNACTSIKNWYAKLQGDKEYTFEKSADFHTKQGTKYNKIFYENYFKFAIVRNPWERLLSAYKFKFLKKKDSPVPKINKKINGNEKKTISFEQFVKYVCHSKDKQCDVHWQPQVNFLDDIKIDYLGRMETLEKDLKEISKKIGVKIEIGKLNASNKYDLNDHYTPLLAKKVEERYKKDIKEFGYSLEETFE
ncbi:MAG: sulfotransferase family 2 domain-containing protein [Candidatus Diapherotrites archaeon]|jgi:hypothetical protein|uniref:Sulfotransferase family 2 domain-containing protein n=1 Tax=Candidatus Iainarchaeum sp. TaxID=3101447 RepID=A0A8T5GEJ5_9ARCH|nr:sulfotransferase family 2 domain-containing protein [Candidatus Diapherotrites archaeon]MBT7241653.1 sulfotransferase family 2 domain-containing protein [Candidatus Diapherotrites archaeon]